MKIILTTFLFFCLAITTVLAQATIDIAAPENGLSNNPVDDFTVFTSGTILNNSAIDATTTLLGSTVVTANPNITAGSEATLILFQVNVDGNGSTLDGTIEVFGGEAGLIIANPNGISCNGCGFINASRVDLVEGTYNIDTGISDISEDGGITVGVAGLNAASVGILNIQTNNFANDGAITANTFNLSAAGDFDYDEGTIIAETRNFNVAGIFSSDTNTDFIWGANDSLTVSGTANIVADSFSNSGNITADTLALSVEGDFDYVADYLDSNITTSSLNLRVGGDFSNNDANNDFVWGANDSLVITSGGDANITTYNFANYGSIEILVSGSSLNITAGYTVINRGTITAPSLNVTAADFFRNLTDGSIDVEDNLNIVAGGKVTNTATIDVLGILSITANNDSTRTNDTTGFYVSNRGNITATSLNIAAVDNFYNRGNITATNFQITRAKSVFFLNREINSFYAAGHTYDGGTISLDGDSGFIADGSIENYGNIDLGSNNLDISADSFTNQAGANVTANTVNLTVNSLIQNGTINATINQ